MKDKRLITLYSLYTKDTSARSFLNKGFICSEIKGIWLGFTLGDVTHTQKCIFMGLLALVQRISCCSTELVCPTSIEP